ncbi:MAG: glycine betaine ABC transporter substrate-binding protein [Peptococcaceae bacterium]|nr:glycine betaine ABC transporter substrate-binding protein [Peptococcaceae bacterium]
MLSDMWTVFSENQDFYARLLLQHIEISLAAILIALVFGGLAGILISEWQRAAKPTLGVINFLYTIPSISMLGFLIPFSGVGNVTAIIALTIYALLPMVRNTHTGLTNVSPAIIEAAKGMGSTRFQILYKISLPLAMPVIMSGIRSMVTMTIALGGIASFIGAGGLGVAIYRGITTNNAAMTMVGSLLIAILALVVDAALGIVEKRIGVRSLKAKRHNRIAAAVAAVLCVAIVGVAFVGGGTKDTIHIATKPMTEQYILGEMLDILIEQDTNLDVELTTGVGGGTSNIQPGMVKGDFDLYPEYTGTGWNMVLKQKGAYTEDDFDTLQKDYEKRYNMKWVGMYGFENTYALAVRREVAEKYDLKTCSDLAKVADELTFGANYDYFEREDGYKAFCKAYGLNFGNTMDIDIGLRYQAIDEGKIDATVGYTTDAQLASDDVVVLKDDKGFFPSYMCSNVVRQEVLDLHPELADVLEKLDGKISNSDMVKMNAAVEIDKKAPRDVAEDFLRSRDLLK